MRHVLVKRARGIGTSERIRTLRLWNEERAIGTKKRCLCESRKTPKCVIACAIISTATSEIIRQETVRRQEFEQEIRILIQKQKEDL